MLERLDHLLELARVIEEELDPPGRHPGLPAGQPSKGRACAFGEGRVDATTALGKAPGEIVRRAGTARCVVFGGIVEQDVPGADTVALSSNPTRAREDLVALGLALG